MVRSSPSVGTESQILTPHLGKGDRLFVVDGPTERSGYQWYLVEPLPRDSATHPPFGWVAAAGHDAEPWIAGLTLACPTLPVTLATLTAMADTERLACYGAARLSFTAYDRAVGSVENPCTGGWIPGWFIGGGTGGPLLGVVFAPGLRAELAPKFGVPFRIRGHFDDPISANCRVCCDLDGEDWCEPQEMSRLHCRTQFVVTERVPQGDE